MNRIAAEQESLIQKVAEAHTQVLAAKLHAHEQAEWLIADSTRRAREAEDDAILAAVERGVPKSTIGKLGLGTSDHHTVNAALDRARQRRGPSFSELLGGPNCMCGCLERELAVA